MISQSEFDNIKPVSKIVFFILFLFSYATQAELKCEHVYSIKTHFFLNNHIKKFKPNSVLERRTVSEFIDRMDSLKIYLTQKQENEFRKELSGIFKKTQENNCKPIFSVYKKFLKYFDTRMAFVRKKAKIASI